MIKWIRTFRLTYVTINVCQSNLVAYIILKPIHRISIRSRGHHLKLKIKNHDLRYTHTQRKIVGQPKKYHKRPTASPRLSSASTRLYSSPLGCTRLHSAPLGSLLGRRRGRERRGCRGCRGSGRRLLRQLGRRRELRRRATSYTALHVGPVNVTAYRVYYNI